MPQPIKNVAKKKTYKIGLVDADLLCNGTRHPNLALLKIAGYLRDNDFVRKSEATSEKVNTYELLTNDSNFDDLGTFDHIYVSVVFSFTYDDPPALLSYLMNKRELKKKVHIGGTGDYANFSIEQGFVDCRKADMERLPNDKFLNSFVNKSGTNGIDMRIQMPDYHLYDEYIAVMETVKASSTYFKDYKEYSIGFLTRGCFRQCPFCVNKLEKKVMQYSPLESFYDPSRKYIYLWDDNFLATPHKGWKPMLEQLMATNKPFQFRQGLDERMIAQSPDGEEMAQMLSKAKYHGDFIFAFDNWEDRPIIEKALKIWKHYCPNKGTKFYLFCGFKQTKKDFNLFYTDIEELFQRIKVLMSYGCVGYVMRHEDYHQAPISNFYVQIARWCNQQAFYKKLSFWEFCYRNQSYWEETKGVKGRPKLMSFSDFLKEKESGYYEQEGMKLCLPVKTILDILDAFPEHRDNLIEMFSYKMSELKNPALWE